MPPSMFGIHTVFGGVHVAGAIWFWVKHQIGLIKHTINVRSIWVHCISFGDPQTIIVVDYDAIEGIHTIFGGLHVAGAIWFWVKHQIGLIKHTINVRSIWVHWISFGDPQTIIVVDYDAIEGIHTIFGGLHVAGAIWYWVEHQIGLINHTINISFGDPQTIIVVDYDAIEGIHTIFGGLHVAGAIWFWVKHQIGLIKHTINVRSIWVHCISFGDPQTIIVVDYDAIEGIHTIFGGLHVAGAIWCWVECRIYDSQQFF
ncbi:hypothetical protein B0H14DRAFT_2565044 [Mycena olivaceomarginata]|nr:hypothetical protein B0H14DRAFT_2565044 [Mycena olivaceomarginata]